MVTFDKVEAELGAWVLANGKLVRLRIDQRTYRVGTDDHVPGV